jgi:hypothetical protein
MDLIDILVTLDPRTCFALEIRVDLLFLGQAKHTDLYTCYQRVWRPYFPHTSTFPHISTFPPYFSHISPIFPSYFSIFPHSPTFIPYFLVFLHVSTFPIHISPIFLRVSVDLIHFARIYISRNSCNRLLSKFVMSLNYGCLTLKTRA